MIKTMYESNLEITEFRNKLIANTKVGYPKFKLTVLGTMPSFRSISKTFYGLVDDNSFQLTQNYFVVPATSAVITGNYAKKNTKLIVDYKISPRTKFELLWPKIWAITALTGLNFLFFSSFKITAVPIYTFANCFVITGYFLSIWIDKRRRKRFEKIFIIMFELHK